jgi:hypothetical protein
MSGPSLESLEHGSPKAPAEDDLSRRVYNVMFKATSQAFGRYQKALKKCEANSSVSRKLVSAAHTHSNSDFNISHSQDSESQATLALCSSRQRILSYIEIVG